MRVAVDVDNVTLEWQDTWIETYEHWFDREVDQDHIGDWDAMVTATHFESPAEFWIWFQQAGVWHLMSDRYVPGAQAGLQWMRDAGHHIVFVTARPNHGERSARQMAMRWFSPVEFLGDQSKHLAKADVWIDDSPHVLASLDEHGKTAIRLERPWNKGAPSTFSAPHWPGILDILKEITS